jgi:LmbE family N-acetylglucosaminyl deacetylase
MEHYRPQVVVTYDDNGFYGHPDHIQAHRITIAAAEKTGIPKKIYFTAVPRSAVIQMMKRMREMGIEPPGNRDDAGEEGREEGESDADEAVPDDPPFGTPDELIAAVIDVTPLFERKQAALAAHRSQVTENSWFLQMPEEARRIVFGREAFVRHYDTTGAPIPEDDLFAGLR